MADRCVMSIISSKDAAVILTYSSAITPLCGLESFTKCCMERIGTSGGCGGHTSYYLNGTGTFQGPVETFACYRCDYEKNGVLHYTDVTGKQWDVAYAFMAAPVAVFHSVPDTGCLGMYKTGHVDG